MRIAWVSGQDSQSHHDDGEQHHSSYSTTTPFVEYGWSLDPSSGEPSYDHRSVQTGPSSSYTADDMCCSPATVDAPGRWRHPGFIHSVLMDGLPFGKEIYYRYGQPGGPVRENKFRTMPDPAASANATFNFLAWGDQGIDLSCVVGAVAPSDSTSCS